MPEPGMLRQLIPVDVDKCQERRGNLSVGPPRLLGVLHQPSKARHQSQQAIDVTVWMIGSLWRHDSRKALLHGACSELAKAGMAPQAQKGITGISRNNNAITWIGCGKVGISRIEGTIRD